MSAHLCSLMFSRHGGDSRVMLSSMDNYSWKALAGYRLCFHRFALGVYRLWAFLLTVDMLFLNGSTVNRKPEPHVVECMLIVWFSLSLSHPANKRTGEAG